MDELKACPFCGSSNTTLDYYEISCPQELGTIVVCNDCGASAKSIVDWNTRPIEDALLARAEKAEAENATLKEERRWIPVREQMPTPGTQWVLLKNGKMDFDFTYIDGGRYDWWRNGSNVTHWMPLPEPPEVEKRVM